MAYSYLKKNCFNCEQTKDLPEEDLQWLAEHNLSLDIACNRCYPEVTLEDAKWMQERRLGLSMICKDCHERFQISPDELVWLLEHDLILFKRCYDCRMVNKEKREAKELLEQIEAEIEVNANDESNE